MDTYLLLNGPNLNRLGKREPAIYGYTTLQDIEQSLMKQAEQAGARLTAFQSNHEGAIIDRLHEAEDEGISGIIFNPGAFTHYSRAIGDAVAAISVPVVEIHISNIHAREAFRHQSVIAPYAAGQLCGFGIRGYSMALDFFLQQKGEA